MRPESKHKREKKRRDSFWRALRYLWPHKRLMAISFVCALLVGVTFTGGLGTLLPIMEVLIKNGTLEDWVNRSIAENRLSAQLVERAGGLQVVDADKPPAAPLTPGVTITLPPDQRPPDDRAAISSLLSTLSDPAVRSTSLLVDRVPATIPLAEVSRPRATARAVAQRMPVNPVKAIGVVLAALVVLAVFGNIVRFFQEFLSEKSAVLAVRDMRLHVYDHSLRLPLSHFGQQGTSDITSRLTADAQNLQDGLKHLLGNSIQEPIKALMALGLALYVSWQLTLFIIIFAPLMIVLIRKFGKHIRRAARAAMQNTALMLGQVEGTLSGIRVVKAAGAERFERRRFREIANGLASEQLRIARLDAINTPTFEVLTLVVVCVVVLYAAFLVLVRKDIDNTQFFLVMACLMGIGESLRKTSKISNIIQKSNAAAARLFEVLDTPAERARSPLAVIEREPMAVASGNGQIQGGTGGPPVQTLETHGRAARATAVLPPLQREIVFDDISFTYPGASQPALTAVTLHVKKGESIAVVGRNGSGKTTLLALLPRFYSPDSGRVLIDGTDIARVSLPSLRKQIAVVTQDSVIFPGTIADNIAYAQPLAKRDQIVEAARKAFAHDFILEKPHGYDTVLGEHGAQLSGGQKQRLCIARAILRQAPILILDEATSQVDAESEHLIQQAIESLMHERTTFVIAHRFSTILSADRIVVLDRGQVVGQGKHEELLADCPTYRQLYERQLVGV